MENWIAAETTTHQDHVIAHVVGASVLGHFVFDETAYLLLDIGFVWNVYLNGEMGLVPYSVAVTDLEIDDAAKAELRADMNALLKDGSVGQLHRMTSTQSPSPIHSVEFLMKDDSRCLLLNCERGQLSVETSLATRDVKVIATET